MHTHRSAELRISAVLIFLTLLGVASLYGRDPHTGTAEREIQEASFFGSGEKSVHAATLVRNMSDPEVLGQVLMLGYEGTGVSPELLDFITDYHIGNIKIFGWNVESLGKLAESIGTMQKTAMGIGQGIPLIIATDQEGGWVRHIKAGTSITAGNLAIGATGLPYDAYYSGYYIGQELKSLGVNMNFAPTVDVYTNPEAHVIGPRAFSDDPVKTAALAVAYFHGLENAGIIATAKHFPGHGNASEDSHGAMPVIDTDLTTLWDVDLLPYRHLVREGIPAIMSGHLCYPRIGGENTPATISPYIQQNILRQRLGFDGIAITDDLMMNGVLETGLGFEEIAYRALKSGNDIILISRNTALQKRVIERLLKEMESDSDFNRQIRRSAERVVYAKLVYLGDSRPEDLVPDADAVRDSVPSPEGEAFFFDLACRSVSLYRNADIPVTGAESGRLLLAGQFSDFIDEGKKRFSGADTFYFPYDPFYTARADIVQALKWKIPAYDTVIFCLANPNSSQVLQQLKDTFESSGTRLIVLSVLTPVYLREFPWVRSAVAVYGLAPASFQAGFAVISGDYNPRGSIPLRFGSGEPAGE